MSPQLIFGTATFGMDRTEFQDTPNIPSVLKLLREKGVKRIDSAARYPPLNPGRAEELIGECADTESGFLVDTKIDTDFKTDGSGDLTAEAIDASIGKSLSRLQRASVGVNILHMHRADPSTPVRDQVRAFNDQIRKGHCRAWGVSNVPLPMLEEMLDICEEEGLQKPACYQGEYNIITRGAETKLLPLLRKHGVALNAYRPLAAGFMTGNFVKGTHSGTRFGDDNPVGRYSQKLYGTHDLHVAMKSFDDCAAAYDLSTAEIALRWVFYHSALRGRDGVVFGASKTRQAVELFAMLDRGPLPPQVLEGADELWNAVRESREDMF